MLFRNEESSLRLDIVNYGFPPDGGDPTSDDRNWLVLVLFCVISLLKFVILLFILLP